MISTQIQTIPSYLVSTVTDKPNSHYWYGTECVNQLLLSSALSISTRRWWGFNAHLKTDRELPV